MRTGCSENDNNYPCIINYNKIYATQFHTEKSHKNERSCEEF